MTKYWHKYIIGVIPLVCGLLILISCAVNRVTGQQELILMPEGMEIKLGQEKYAPSRQLHGGDYRLDPKLTRYVNEVGQRLAVVSDRKLPFEFTVLNNSKPNAWALPGGKIAINRGLLVELKSEAELAAVLGHEIVHAAARHGAKRLERDLFLNGALLVVAMVTGSGDYSALALGGVVVGSELISQGYSKEAELEADHYGIVYMVRAGYDPWAAIELQETFLRLSKAKKSNWLSGLFASHPPSEERVKQNKAIVASLKPENGIVGVARYRKETAHLVKVKPAYDAYENGCRALEAGDYRTAKNLSQKAMQIEPREALFSSLLGDALTAIGDQQAAMTCYNDAVEKDAGFFRHYLQRGLLSLKLGQRQQARQDLEKSLKLLPTADANHGLGHLTLAEGRERKAVRYFRKAADSHSEIGKAAALMLHRLDLPNNPDRYLKTSLKWKKKCIEVTIKNPTSVPVTRIDVMMKKGKQKKHFTISQTILPGERLKYQTDVKVAERKELYRWRVTLEKAAIGK